MNLVSGAGAAAVFNGASPKFADISLGYAYAIVLANQTAADITAATLTIEHADPDPNDMCVPGAFAPIDVAPECDSLPGAVSGPATITLSASTPLKAGAQCSFAAPCPKKFVRVAGVGVTGVDVFIVVTRLKQVTY